MAWARSHHFSQHDHLLYLNLQKLHSDQLKDDQCQLYILTPLINRILQQVHDTAIEGHSGAAKTYMAMKHWFICPGMWKGAQDYTKGCDMCAQVNQLAGKVVGLPKQLPVVQGGWEYIGVDFITGMPISLGGNDCIVAFMDHFSKCAHVLPCIETIHAAEFAQWLVPAII